MDILGTGSEQLKITTALDYADGAADRNGATLNMAGFEGVLMVVKLGAVAAGGVNSIKAQQGAKSDASDMADLAGTGQAIADTDDNDIFIVDLVRPREQYVRLVVDKDAVNNMAESAIYIQYGARQLPTALAVANAVRFERHISPAEGVA